MDIPVEPATSPESKENLLDVAPPLKGTKVGQLLFIWLISFKNENKLTYIFNSLNETVFEYSGVL